MLLVWSLSLKTVQVSLETLTEVFIQTWIPSNLNQALVADKMRDRSRGEREHSTGF